MAKEDNLLAEYLEEGTGTKLLVWGVRMPAGSSFYKARYFETVVYPHHDHIGATAALDQNGYIRRF